MHDYFPRLRKDFLSKHSTVGKSQRELTLMLSFNHRMYLRQSFLTTKEQTFLVKRQSSGIPIKLIRD